MKSIGSYGHVHGDYLITVWQVRRHWLVRYEFTCDVCDLTSARLRSSNEAWAGARTHCILHGEAANERHRGVLRYDPAHS